MVRVRDRRVVVAVVLIVGLLGVAAALLLRAGSDPVERDGVRVVRVIDGDTLVVSLDGGEPRVRLIGIDAPETTNGHHDCAGAEATAALRKLVDGRDVQLVADPSQSDTDRYDRLLRYVELDGQDVGYRLLVMGLAREYTYSSGDPYQRQGDYRSAQQTAQLQSDGGWYACGWSA